MTRYKKEVEAILYTGDNVEEIKEFLGDCFIGLDEERKIWYKQTPNSERRVRKWLVPMADMIVGTIERDFFWDEYEDDFLEEWERIELNGTI